MDQDEINLLLNALGEKEDLEMKVVIPQPFKVGDIVKVRNLDSDFCGKIGTVVEYVQSRYFIDDIVKVKIEGLTFSFYSSDLKKLDVHQNCCESKGSVLDLVDEMMKEDDPVSHPSHYTNGSIECIDAMEAAFGKEDVIIFSKLNAFKYIWRCKLKNNELEDLEKASWYLNKAIKLLKEVSESEGAS